MSAKRVIDDHLELANIGTKTHAQIDTHIADPSAHHVKYTDAEARNAMGDIDNPCNVIYIDSGDLGEAGNNLFRIQPEPAYRHWLRFYNLTSGAKALLAFGSFEVSSFYVSTWSGIHKTGIGSPYWFIWLNSSNGKIELNHISKITFEDDAILRNLKNHAYSALSGTKKLVEIDLGGAPYYIEASPTKA